jgi:hypothetical protein
MSDVKINNEGQINEDHSAQGDEARKVIEMAELDALKRDARRRTWPRRHDFRSIAYRPQPGTSSRAPRS